MQQEILSSSGSLDHYIRKLSKRLNSRTKSVRIVKNDKLIAVIMNVERYMSASYARKSNARRRVYRKTFIHLIEKSISVQLPTRFEPDDLASMFGAKQYFPAIFLQRSKYGKSSVCISPKQFRLFVSYASIRKSYSGQHGYLNGLPLVRKNGRLSAYASEVAEWN